MENRLGRNRSRNLGRRRAHVGYFLISGLFYGVEGMGVVLIAEITS